jgi:Zn-dependent protease with chaperone function
MQAAIETAKQIEIKERRCPQCGATIPVHPHYIVWCDQCNWNLDARTPEKPQNFFDSLYVSMGKRFSQSLFEKTMKAEVLKPEWTFSKVAALAVAVVVHGVTVTLAILSLICFVKGYPYFMFLVYGVIFAGLAWLLRPRLGKWPKDVLPAAKFPALYSFVGRIAQALNTPNVDGTAVDGSFSAAFDQVGWQRKRILYLGWPLFLILDDQEKVALVAHELAHGVNGDPLRSFFVGSAVNTLIEWHLVIRPDDLLPAHQGGWAFLMLPINLAGFALAGLIWLAGYALVHLLWRDSQRAEFLADYPSATVAGTDAALSALDKSLLDPAYE